MIRYQITDGTGHPYLRSDADLIQIREPSLSTRELCAFARQAVAAGHRILINDRTDVALASGAAGVHLRSGSVAPILIRKITPAGFIITVACHSAEDVSAADGADYAILAPVFKPLSKDDHQIPLGLDLLQSIASRARIRVIALGGITEANAPFCVDAGAVGVAGITLFRRP